jgi:hypothetical protein
VLGISVDESEEWLKEHVSELASLASDKLGKGIRFTPEEVLANPDYCAAGYGVLTEREREAIRLFATHEGVLLDPVYTGRAAAGMIDLIRKEFSRRMKLCCSYTQVDNQRCSRINTRTRFKGTNIASCSAPSFTLRRWILVQSPGISISNEGTSIISFLAAQNPANAKWSKRR